VISGQISRLISTELVSFFGLFPGMTADNLGRTGRFGRKGCSVIFAHDQRSMSEVQEIADTLGKPMRRINATSQTDLEQLEIVRDQHSCPLMSPS
jgi:hypothetical protein